MHYLRFFGWSVPVSHLFQSFWWYSGELKKFKNHHLIVIIWHLKSSDFFDSTTAKNFLRKPWLHSHATTTTWQKNSIHSVIWPEIEPFSLNSDQLRAFRDKLSKLWVFHYISIRVTFFVIELDYESSFYLSGCSIWRNSCNRVALLPLIHGRGFFLLTTPRSA